MHEKIDWTSGQKNEIRQQVTIYFRCLGSIMKSAAAAAGGAAAAASKWSALQFGQISIATADGWRMFSLIFFLFY